MGVIEPKYNKVDTGVSVPVVPVATAVDAGGLENPSTLPTATKVDKGFDHDDNERDDGITITWEKGEVQESRFRDKWFAVAFILHLFAVAGTGVAFGPAAWKKFMEDAESADHGEDQYGESATEDVTGTEGAPKGYWLSVVSISMVTAPVLSFAALTVMSKNAIALIKASLWFSVVLCGISAVALMAVAPLAGIFYSVFTVCLIWYARLVQKQNMVCSMSDDGTALMNNHLLTHCSVYHRSVQSRIPYAASNLKCGITVLKSNLGLGLIAAGSMMGLLLYSFGWVYAFAGTMSLDAMQDGTSEDDASPLAGFVAFVFVLSFYWTHQVMKNVVRSTVSGVVGTWWFSPVEASSFCSTSVVHSLIRSTTYSLGSICFGSLIVAILHMLRNSLRRAQNDRNAGILRCIAMCLLAYIEALAEYLNKWAYIYVGLYGYDYITAGKKVISLFKTRGWQAIIADNLVNRLLGIVSLTIGLLTGVCSLFAAFLVEEFDDKEEMGAALGLGFVSGFFIGIILSGIFMGLLSSAVDAIIVCYAEAPKELEENHPAIAQEMSRTWSEAWGNLCGPVIIGLGGGLGVV